MEIEIHKKSSVNKKPSLTSRSTTNISKSPFHKTKMGKCQHPSVTLYRNPYLNFLREFRQRNNGLSAVDMIRQGAKQCRSMTRQDKLKYIEEALQVRKKRKAPPAPPPARVQQRKKKRRKKGAILNHILGIFSPNCFKTPLSAHLTFI